MEESEKTLGQMALNRLKYPYALRESDKEMYQTYVKEHISGIAFRFVQQKSLDMLRFLIAEHLMDRAALLECSKTAAEYGWPEGSAYFLQCLAKEHHTKENRYNFDME